MPRELEKLSTEERQQMLDAIALITILVGTADGEMDEEEKGWAAKLTDIRAFEEKGVMSAYYEAVGAEFSERLQAFDKALPTEVSERMSAASEKIAALNPIMRKMDDFDAAAYYKSFLSFAKHVAQASGGIMRFMSIGPEEKEVMTLPMLDEFKV